MRFHRITLERFRGIDATTVEFGDAITIIEGPNEAGKSTIAEAITVLFDHLDSSRRQEVRAVHQIGADVGPYVELDFSVGEYAVTYAKRFLRKPSTELRITAPAPEQHTGREAHERMATILKETVDDELWAAMRVEQGASLLQPNLADVGALRAALDDGARADVGSDDDLMRRIVDEFTRYFTPRTGQPTGDLSAAVDAHVRAQQAYDAVAADLARVDTQVRRAGAVETELSGLADEEAQHRRRFDELTRSERELGALRRIHADAQAEVAAKDERLRTAHQVAAGRGQLVAELAQRQAVVEEAHAEVERLRVDAKRTQAIADDARDAARTARDTARQHELAHRDAADAAQHARLSRDLEALDERVARAAAARDEVVAADAVLAAADLDDDALQRLADLDADVRTARELRSVGASSIEIESLGDAEVDVAGADADAGRQAVVRRTVVEVPGAVRVTVRPGSADDELAEGLRTAESALATALEDAGVADLAAAREAVAARREATTARQIASGRLRDALGDTETYDELAARAGGIRERVEKLSADRDVVPVRSVDDADRAADEARAAYDEAGVEANDREQQAAACDTDAAEVRESLIRAEQRHDSERAEVERFAERLATERSSAPDEQLHADVRQAQADQVAAVETRDRAADALAGAEPEQLATRLDTARAVGERLARSRRALEDERQQIAGQLDGFAARGLHDQHDAAAAELERAEGVLTRVEARADSARLLHDTMQRHRDTARQRYVGPFRKAVESLGRVVFGDDVTIDVTDELTIASRTVAGRTVAFDSLSGGAREQLAVLGRLAAADLVDTADGAPLILDDAFGYADPERLERIAAVLSSAGRTTQIIILTCHPERFRSVGGDDTAIRRLC